MGQLSGLPGTDGKAIECVWFFSPSGGIKALRNNRAVTASSDYGSINIWKDDAGNYRGERHAYRVTQDSITVKAQRELYLWLKKNVPKIHKPVTRG